MKKIIKIPIIFLFTFFSSMLLVIDVDFSSIYLGYVSVFYQISLLLKRFDIIDNIVFIVLFCFYYDIYFDSSKYGFKNLIISVVSIFLSFFVAGVLCYQTVDFFSDISMYVVLIQFLLMFVGTYLLLYAIFKKILLFLKKV